MKAFCRSGMQAFCDDMQDKAAPSNLSTEHDGPVPRLALEALAVPPSHGPDATHSTESPPTDLLTPEQPTQAQEPSHMPEASHEDTSDAIAEGFGLPSSARDPIRAPSEAPSDAFTDTPRAGAATKQSHQDSSTKPKAASSLYERILAQQQKGALARRKPSADGSRAAGQPTDTGQPSGNPQPTRHAGVPDPSDWSTDAKKPAAVEPHRFAGVPDPSNWQRVPHPSDWQHQAPPPDQLTGPTMRDSGAAAEGETATREMELTAVGRAEGDHEVTTPPQKAAPKYSYLQQIGVIGKGPPPMPSEAAQARQHFRSSPKHPSDTGRHRLSACTAVAC